MNLGQRFKELVKQNKFVLTTYLFGWIFACFCLLFLAYIFWPQLYYWPYDWPESPWSLGKLIVHSIIVLMVAFLALGVFLFYRIDGQTKKDAKLKMVSIVLSVFFFNAGIFALIFTSTAAPYRVYDAGPYITWGPNQDPKNSITICWHSQFLTYSEVKYGKDPQNLLESAFIFEVSQVHKVAINNLEPDTIYYYKIPGFDLKSFKTAPSEDAEFSFLFWSDPRTNNPLSSALQGVQMTKFMYEHAQADNYRWDFSVNGGDITSRGVDYQTWKLWFDDIGLYDFASNQSHLIAVGNHERHDDRGGRWMGYYYPYQKYADVQFSYSIIYGNVQLVFLDRWIPDDSWYTGDDQYLANWLKNELNKHPNVRFRLIFMHVNPSVTNGHHGNNTGIMKVASEYRVNAIFCGHTHSYLTSYFNGTDFDPLSTPIIDSGQGNGAVIQAGLGGNTNKDGTEMYLRVNVNHTNITIQPITFNNHKMSSMVIK